MPILSRGVFLPAHLMIVRDCVSAFRKSAKAMKNACAKTFLGRYAKLLLVRVNFSAKK